MLSWNSLAFSMIQRILAISSLVPLSCLNPACTSGSSILFKPSLKGFEHYLGNMRIHCVTIRDLIQVIPEWLSGFPCFLPITSEFCNKELKLSHLQVLFLLKQSFSIFGCKEYSQSNFSTDHLVMYMCKVISHVVGREFAMTNVFSWQNSVTLCPEARLACYSRHLLTSFFCNPILSEEKDIFSGVSSRRSCMSLQNHLNSAYLPSPWHHWQKALCSVRGSSGNCSAPWTSQ